MVPGRFAKSAFLGALVIGAAGQLGFAQDSSGNKSWTATSEQGDVSGSTNRTRTTESHKESDGRSTDRTSTQTLGPDGRYVPYQDIENQSVRVNDTTVRNTVRTFGRGPDGQRILVQEQQEETRSLPDGGKKIVRTTSNPDADGKLQVVQRELSDSKQLSPGVRDTKTTIFSPDGSGGLAASVQVDERESKGDGGIVNYKKSTSLSDGAGHFALSEVRESTTTPNGAQASSKEERVLRPDSDGKLALIERTVTHQSDAGGGEKRGTTETYSTNVPGQAGDEGLRLVQRESTVQKTSANGQQSTVRQTARPNPGDPSAGLQVTQQAIDIVRTDANGVARQQSTIVTTDANGQTNQVWVDMGKSDKPAPSQTPAQAPAKASPQPAPTSK
ncbi:MAG TPA: hypothetical protein VMH04_22755 [Candidatus Solibacter sp.]|nr:hypothetical protein [Candidatus Solibacter sp.]